MASNAYSLVHAVLLVCFERARSPAVAAATTDCLKAILSSMASGAGPPSLHSSQMMPLVCRMRPMYSALLQHASEKKKQTLDQDGSLPSMGKS